MNARQTGPPVYNAPQYVSFRSEPLPRNPAAKVLKRVLRDDTVWGDEFR